MRVLCINGDFSNAGERVKYLVEVPKQMEEYTVREVVKRSGAGRIVEGYILEEVNGGISPNGLEVSFNSSRFINITEIDTLEETTKEECLINSQ